jgi:hypothetical protein
LRASQILELNLSFELDNSPVRKNGQHSGQHQIKQAQECLSCGRAINPVIDLEFHSNPAINSKTSNRNSNVYNITEDIIQSVVQAKLVGAKNDTRTVSLVAQSNCPKTKNNKN